MHTGCGIVWFPVATTLTVMPAIAKKKPAIAAVHISGSHAASILHVIDELYADQRG